MIYCFWLVIATGAFWVVEMWHVDRALRRPLPDGALAGRASTRGWLRFGVTFLVPIAFAVTVPAEAVTSRLDWETLLLSVVFAVALFGVNALVLAVRAERYSGASA